MEGGEVANYGADGPFQESVPPDNERNSPKFFPFCKRAVSMNPKSVEDSTHTEYGRKSYKSDNLWLWKAESFSFSCAIVFFQNASATFTLLSIY